MFSVTWRNADRVPGTTFDLVRRMTIRTCAALGCASAVWSLSAAGVAAEERSLKLYFGHTGERAIITFKRNGVFDPYGLKQLNGFLRDWRQNKTINMDPRLFDIVWEMYRRSGATDYINVVSGYRSPGTNAMLRTRSSGVAKESQHTQGKAIDFFIPGVKLATLRGLAMQTQGGGVGYYPTSGSPFVHVDVGRIRAWPRMSYQELARLFPDGKTLHIASDGRTLPGYAFAVAEYKRRGSVASVEIASAAQDAKRSRGSMLSNLFGDRDAKEQGDARSQATEALPAPAAKEATALVAGPDSSLALIKAPVPSARPPESILLTSLVPSKMPPGSQALNDLISDTATVYGGRYSVRRRENPAADVRAARGNSQ
ncbi:DUF882 domain-containing protein [Rhizobium sp. BK377]|uniref:DUF882 domain-containing protein n=1 Tax=Rhizobium sp. BK377 TaxID=2587058 RepID=UPI00184D3528|nr:DUF882 domain-containing protein [Rhizobium sp. BK377]MBB3462232.1 uncharacterized protein YcbK (DUF882 family) [Rhizobium sp. BK377]